MSVFAYIRVSDSKKQDSSSQRHVIGEYATTNSLNITNWSEFNISGSKSTTEERGIDTLVDSLVDGDHVIISDVARLGRADAIELLVIIKSILSTGATLHFAYNMSHLVPSDLSDMGKLFMLLGESIMAVKFAEERSRKAKAAIQVRTNAGLHNGRKKGAVVKSKLDPHAVMILDELSKSTPKTEIVKQLAALGTVVSRNQLYLFIDKKLGGLK